MGHSFADQTHPCPKTFTVNRVWGLTSFPSHHSILPVQPEWGKPVPNEESPILHLGAKPSTFLFFQEGLDVQELKHGTQKQALAPNPWLPDRHHLPSPRTASPRLESTQGQGKTPALKHRLTKVSCWGGFSARRGCFYTQVIGYSSQNLTSRARGARRQARGRVIQNQIVGFEGLFKKRNSKVLRASPTDFASNTLVFKYCVHESSPRAISCTL